MEKQRDNHIEQTVTEQHTTEQGGIYRKIRDFALDETGVGVIELVLILVVLVSLVIVFKKQINKLSSVHKYSEINFHLILFPVPDKTKIVNWFISQAKNLKNDADE